MLPGPQIPFSRPGAFHFVQHALAKQTVFFFDVGRAQGHEFLEYQGQEKAQPHAFARFSAHPVHAVVPVAPAHEGQAVRAESHGIDGPQTVGKQRFPFRGNLRLLIAVFLRFAERRGYEIGLFFRQDAFVPGDGNVPGVGNNTLEVP